MKFKGVLTLVILIGLASAALAQEATFTGFYPLVGSVISEDPDISTTGRKVVFYLDLEDPAAAFSYDYVGEPGLSGQANQYFMNAFQDYRMPVDVGRKYYIAVVKGTDNYGANPVEVSITGYGFERFPTLTLREGEGIDDPGFHISRFAPKIEAIWFGHRLWQPALVALGESFIISDQPDIKCEISCDYGINVSSLQIIQDEGTATAKTYNVSTSDISTIRGMAESPTEISYVYSFSEKGQNLSDGDHSLTFKASNAYGTTIEVCAVTIKAGPVEVIGTPINYPSPIHLRTDKEVIFQYGLTKDADIDIYLFDISARIVKKISCDAGQPGGSAGGTANPNKVTWDLITDQGSKIGSGIYLWNIVDRAGNRVLNKGKLTAVP